MITEEWQKERALEIAKKKLAAKKYYDHNKIRENFDITIETFMEWLNEEPDQSFWEVLLEKENED
jgi:hypothetical protein